MYGLILRENLTANNYYLSFMETLKMLYSIIRNKFSVSEMELVKKRKRFYRQFVGRGDLYFDVGANIGNRIRPMIEIGARIIAVEPQEYCCKYLKYAFGKKITVVKKGLCEEEGVRTFYIASSHTISSFSDQYIESVSRGRFKEFSWDTGTNVQMTTLDKLIELYGKPAFIKIDVEGYEPEVLAGLTQKIKVISFEYTTPELHNNIIECIAEIHRYGKIMCNYSVGESMVWALNDWITAGEFLQLIQTREFIETGFGDIYVKSLE